jgi:type I restriction enzyme, S subunit
MKYVVREIDSRSTSGNEQLLRVSQYTGVTQRRRADGLQEPDTRADSLVGYKRVDPNDLVINIMLAWNGSMGVSRSAGIASPAYCVYRFGRDVHPWYFHSLLRSTAYKARIKASSTGVVESRLRLYSDDLGRIEALLPPPAEQAAIVRFLNWADGRLERAIRAKRKVIALLNEQKQAIIHRAVTRGLDASVPLRPSGIPWLGDIPQHWEVRRLGKLSKVFNGTTPSRAQPGYWSNGTIPWLASGKVNDRVVNTPSELIAAHALAACSLSIVPSGALLIGLIGQGRTRGMCALLAIDACISQNLAAVVPAPTLSGQYLYYALLASYDDIRELGRGGNQAALNCEIVGRLAIPVPPPSEQLAINRALASEVSHLLREFRTRFVADVVTGKLDVREAAARLPDETPLETAEDDADLSDESEATDEEAAT